MTQRLIRAFAGALILAAFAAPAAQAGDSFLLASNAKFADGLVDPSGTLHAVWTDDVYPENNLVHYCRVPRGATASTTSPPRRPATAG